MVLGCSAATALADLNPARQGRAGCPDTSVQRAVTADVRAGARWTRAFGDALLASAAMDRLLHSAHVVVMDGDTYRNPPPAKKVRAAGTAETADRRLDG